MIEINFGKKVKDYNNEIVKHYVLMIGYGAVVIRNRSNTSKRFFLKWAKGHFALCYPVKLREGASIKYIFGWAVRPRITFISDCYDPDKLSIYLFNKEFRFKR